MRFRKLAGTAAGALVLGALSVPMTMTAAQAAPVSAQTPFSAVCSYSTFSVPVEGNLTVTVDGKSVAANLAATANLNASAQGPLKTTKLGTQLTLAIGGEDVVVKGETTFTPPKAGNEAMAIPAMSGTRASTAYPSTFDVTKGQLDLVITFGAAPAPCTITDIAPVSFPPKPQACVDAENAVTVAQSGHTNATNTANAESAGVSAATASVGKATKAVNSAKSKAKKAASAVKKATKAVKKAKSKAKKAKAKKALTKSKKANTKAKKAVTKANSQVRAAKSQFATASSKSAAANNAVAAAVAAVAAAQAAVVAKC